MTDEACFNDVLFGRRSIRRFTRRRVPLRSIQEMIESATAAPSAHNSQPARFTIMYDCQRRRDLVAAMSELYLADLEKDGISREDANVRVARSKSRLLEAPVLILVSLTMEGMWKYGDEPRQRAEYLMAVQSTAAAIQNMLLSARARGLGTCWLCAPLFCRQLIRTTLEIPDDYDPQAFVIVGHPAENPVAPSKKGMDEIMHIIR